MLRLVLACAVLVLLVAAPAPAAVVDDVAVGAARSDEVAVWGQAVAWRDGTDIVLRAGDGRTRRVPTGSAGESFGMSLGTDAGGRLVLVFPFCRGVPCRLRRVDVRTGRVRTIAGIPAGPHAYPVLRRGVLAWMWGNTVRSRRLDGGRIRREDLGRGPIDLTGLDHDGRRFAITGAGADDPETETSYTEVRVGRFGARRTRYVGGLGASQEYQAVLAPMLNATSVDVLKDDLETFDPGRAYERLIRYPLGRGRARQRSFGVPFTAMARGGGATAIVQAVGSLGCAVGRPVRDDPDDVRRTLVPCRIVRAGGPPFGADTRRTVPEVTLQRRAGGVSGRVVRRLISSSTGRTARTEGVAGAAVRIAPPAGGFAAAGADTTTGADGRFSLAPSGPLASASLLGAFTTAEPQAFAPVARRAG